MELVFNRLEIIQTQHKWRLTIDSYGNTIADKVTLHASLVLT